MTVDAVWSTEATDYMDGTVTIGILQGQCNDYRGSTQSTQRDYSDRLQSVKENKAARHLKMVIIIQLLQGYYKESKGTAKRRQ